MGVANAERRERRGGRGRREGRSEAWKAGPGARAGDQGYRKSGEDIREVVARRDHGRTVPQRAGPGSQCGLRNGAPGRGRRFDRDTRGGACAGGASGGGLRGGRAERGASRLPGLRGHPDPCPGPRDRAGSGRGRRRCFPLAFSFLEAVRAGERSTAAATPEAYPVAVGRRGGHAGYRSRPELGPSRRLSPLDSLWRACRRGG